MKIPRKIKAGCHTYEVVEKKTNDREKGRNNWGRTFLADKKIYLDRELVKSQKEETFLHELLHIAFFQSRMSSDIDEKVLLTEEQIVDRLTSALYPILEDNKLLK